MLSLTHALTLGCAIEDGTAFGMPYTIAASPEPALSPSGEVVFTATFSSSCATGGSEFEVTRFIGEQPVDADASHQFLLHESAMFVAARQPPACASPLPFEQEVTIEVRSPLPTNVNLGVGSTKFLACPPGSTYEMVKLDDERAAAPSSFLNAASDAPRQQVVVPPATRPADWDDEEDGVWQPPPGQENASEAEPTAALPAVDALGGSAAASVATAASA